MAGVRTAIRRRTLPGLLVAVLTVAAGAVVAVTVGTAQAGVAVAETVPAPTAGGWIVDGHGNGHGHGMSQYGARGAARAGLGAAAIVGFYYPGTTVSTLSPSTVRVRLTGSSTAVTVAAANRLTWASGAQDLPSVAGGWRLVPSGSGLAAQYSTGSTWVTYLDGLPARADFSTASGVERYQRDGATSLDYRGTVGAVRSGSGLLAVNRVTLDDYTRGVVPRETPASWEPAAVQAQAIASRSYARYAVEHNGAAAYDICDTDSCQVYGGVMSYASGTATGVGETSASNSAVAATANQVVTYGGAAIFAQFSASDGGWTTPGGQPYLVGQADPYDAAGGSPYTNWTSTVTPATVAGRLGLARVGSISVTGRDGYGDWGGRVTSATVSGTTTGGAATTVSLSGNGLASALGVLGPYLRIRGVGPIGSLDVAGMSGPATYRAAGWTMDTDHTDRPTEVHVYVDATGYRFVAQGHRPDVRAVYGTPVDTFGFDVSVPVPGGNHQVCVYWIDLDGTSNTTARCESVTVGTRAPIGSLDAVTRVGMHRYTLAGWTFDPDHPEVSIRSDSYGAGLGAAGVSAVAAGSRPDVAAAFGLPSAAHGFSTTVLVPGGTHDVCAYGIDVDGVANSVTGCRTVTVPVDAIGAVDAVSPVAGGAVTLTGWSFDPDADGGPGAVHVYVDDVGTAFATTWHRPDVAQAYGLAADTVGFQVAVPVPVGTHQVCAYGINTTGAGGNTLLTCRTVVR